MRKALLILICILLLVNLSACSSTKETSAYNFQYKFKEEYSEIDGSVGAIFIDMVQRFQLVFDTVLDLDNQENDLVFSDYTEEYYPPLHEKIMASPTSFSDKEKEVIVHILNMAELATEVAMLKDEYKLDEINEEMGLKTKYTPDQYEEKSNEFKNRMDGLLEKTKDFIN